jgi:hypothetical protein
VPDASVEIHGSKPPADATSEAAAEVPDKLSFPTEDPAPADQKVLKGDDLDYHPTYGGKRGGILRRFFNSLRGKDYI